MSIGESAEARRENDSLEECFALASRLTELGRELTPAEDERRAIALRKGWESLINYVPLLTKMASQLHYRNRQYLEFDDLFAAGLFGLVEAAMRFDPGVGARFSTYAMWWIRNRMSLALRDHRWCMRIPDSQYRMVLKLGRTVSQFRQMLGRDPTREELEERLGWSRARIEELFVWTSAEVVSLDIPAGTSGHSTLADFIEDNRALGRLVDASRDSELREYLQRLLTVLRPTERKAISYRFGLEDSEPLGIREIARLLQLPPHVIDKTVKRALRKLKSACANPHGAAVRRTITKAKKGLSAIDRACVP